MSWIYPASGLNAEGLSHITKWQDHCRLLLLSDEGQVYPLFSFRRIWMIRLNQRGKPGIVKDISRGWIRLYPGRR